MDNTVIILIGAGVCCMVIGFALFIKLCSSSKQQEEVVDKKLLDDEYAENFQECFKNTGTIEGTLDELASIYTGNQYMYNLIANAIDYIRDEQGDYETALDGINVDSDVNIMKIHNTAIKESLNLEVKDKKENEKYAAIPSNSKTEEVFEEDDFEEDEDELYEEKEKEKRIKKATTVKEDDDDYDDYNDDDEDIDGFMIG